MKRHLGDIKPITIEGVTFTEDDMLDILEATSDVAPQPLIIEGRTLSVSDIETILNYWQLENTVRHYQRTLGVSETEARQLAVTTW